jgi:hypothetical protein
MLGVIGRESKLLLLIAVEHNYLIFLVGESNVAILKFIM